MHTRRRALTALATCAGLATFLSGGVATAAAGVPAPYAHAVATAPIKLCGHDVVNPDLIARQLYGESRFDTRAVSAAGAQGPAQLTPEMFAVYGADDDHNGAASPFDITDAVSAMVRVDCALATALTERGHPADQESIVAAYTGGIAAVDDPQVREYARGMLR